MNVSSSSPPIRRGSSDQDRFGRKVASRLSEASGQLPHDISERLRIARTQALGMHRAVVTRSLESLASSGPTASLHFGDGRTSWWERLASAVPMIALLVGLVCIQTLQNDNRARELAEVDTALLTDDLPPNAFTDPGFAQYLRANRLQGE